MWNFLDESGSFCWADEGISVFCGLSVPDAEIPALADRFVKWKSSIIGESKRELKGQELTPSQLLSFCRSVLPRDPRSFYLTLVGADTRRTAEVYLERLRDQAAALFRLSSELCIKSGNRKLAEMYRQMSGWLLNRSTVNILWIIVLEEAILQTLQHTAIRFLDPEYDSEFENLEIAIDESFVRRDEHVIFWREWLRNGLMKNSRMRGFVTVKDWSERGHPFRRKYIVHSGLYNFNDLFVNHTDFHDSRALVGLQIADICANICYRNFRDHPDSRAYDTLRPRIVGKDGRALTLVTVDERSLHQDDLSNHVRPFDIEAWKRLAEERGRHIHINVRAAGDSE
jgi:Protein of unknown function (DUF3800)